MSYIPHKRGPGCPPLTHCTDIGSLGFAGLGEACTPVPCISVPCRTAVSGWTMVGIAVAGLALNIFKIKWGK